MLCDRRKKAIKNIAYSVWKVKAPLEEFEKNSSFLKNVKAVQVLEKLIEYGLEWEREGKR